MAEMKGETMKTTTVTALEVIPKYVVPEDPSWARARGYCEQIKASVEAIIKLGCELVALRKQYLAQGGETRFGYGSSQGCDEPQNTVTHAQQFGWQAKVREELGISHHTALRLMERSRYVAMLSDVASGELVEYRDTKGEIKSVEPSPELQEQAANALDEVVAGAVNAGRAWAGVVGEGKRKASGATHARADVDHYEVLKGALKSMRNSLKHWRALEPGQRAELETLWAEVSSKLPETWIG
jgi:hypothetical protein